MKNAREIAEEIFGCVGKFAFYVMPGDATREDAIAACESAILEARREAFEEAALVTDKHNNGWRGNYVSCQIRALAERERQNVVGK